MNQVLEKLSMKPFAIISHRGGAGLFPENTLLAFKKSIELGVDLIETDVQVTKDGIPIALHDEDLKRIAGINISVRKSLSTEIFNIKIRGERIPSIEDVLRLCVDHVGVLIEIKVPGDENIIGDVIKSVGAQKWVSLISFYEQPLQNFRKILPEIPLGIIYYQPPGKILDAKKIGLELVLPKYILATINTINFAHKLRLKVIAWTVNDEKWIKELHYRGIDGIATDYPDIAIKIKRSLTK
ncbi:MAG: glycerophosphodiester phosphodiesterase [Thermoprotei archaeon]